MPDWKNVPGREDPPGRKDAPADAPGPVRALVRRRASATTFRRRLFPPGPELAPWVDALWTVDWDLTGRPPQTSKVITFPAMHLTAEWGGPGEVRHGWPMPATLVHGLVTAVFTVELGGAGAVVGARFRPSGFAAWAGVAAADHTDRTVLAAPLLGPAWADLHDRVTAADPETRADRLREALRQHRPAGPPDVELDDLVQRMQADQTLTRVEQLVELTGWPLRTLQRRFRSGVGVGPKWVLARARLQEAALALEQDPEVDLADLAVRLGWYDQAHLTNDFRRMLGETPGRYAAAAQS